MTAEFTPKDISTTQGQQPSPEVYSAFPGSPDLTIVRSGLPHQRIRLSTPGVVDIYYRLTEAAANPDIGFIDTAELPATGNVGHRLLYLRQRLGDAYSEEREGDTRFVQLNANHIFGEPPPQEAKTQALIKPETSTVQKSRPRRTQQQRTRGQKAETIPPPPLEPARVPEAPAESVVIDPPTESVQHEEPFGRFRQRMTIDATTGTIALQRPDEGAQNIELNALELLVLSPLLERTGSPMERGALEAAALESGLDTALFETFFTSGREKLNAVGYAAALRESEDGTSLSLAMDRVVINGMGPDVTFLPPSTEINTVTEPRRPADPSHENALPPADSTLDPTLLQLYEGTLPSPMPAEPGNIPPAAADIVPELIQASPETADHDRGTTPVEPIAPATGETAELVTSVEAPPGVEKILGLPDIFVDLVGNTIVVTTKHNGKENLSKFRGEGGKWLVDYILRRARQPVLARNLRKHFPGPEPSYASAMKKLRTGLEKKFPTGSIVKSTSVEKGQGIGRETTFSLAANVTFSERYPGLAIQTSGASKVSESSFEGTHTVPPADILEQTDPSLAEILAEEEQDDPWLSGDLASKNLFGSGEASSDALPSFWDHPNNVETPTLPRNLVDYQHRRGGIARQKAAAGNDASETPASPPITQSEKDTVKNGIQPGETLATTLVDLRNLLWPEKVGSELDADDSLRIVRIVSRVRYDMRDEKDQKIVTRFEDPENDLPFGFFFGSPDMPTQIFPFTQTHTKSTDDALEDETAEETGKIDNSRERRTGLPVVQITHFENDHFMEVQVGNDASFRDSLFDDETMVRILQHLAHRPQSKIPDYELEDIVIQTKSEIPLDEYMLKIKKHIERDILDDVIKIDTDGPVTTYEFAAKYVKYTKGDRSYTIKVLE